jgi:hypothetical protein
VRKGARGPGSARRMRARFRAPSLRSASWSSSAPGRRWRQGGWAVLGGDRGYRPSAGPCAAVAASVRAEEANWTAHRLLLEVATLRDEGVETHRGLARSLTSGASLPARQRGLDPHDRGPAGLHA